MFRNVFTTAIAVIVVVLPTTVAEEKKEEVVVIDVTKAKEEILKDKDPWLKKYKGKTAEFQVAFFGDDGYALGLPRKTDGKKFVPAYGHALNPGLSSDKVFVAGNFTKNDERNKDLLKRGFFDLSYKAKIRGVIDDVEVAKKGDRHYDVKIEISPAWMVEILESRRRN